MELEILPGEYFSARSCNERNGTGAYKHEAMEIMLDRIRC